MGNEFLAGKFKLAEKAIQRGFFFGGQCKIGHGVEAGFQKSALTVIIGIKSAGNCMFFEDEYLEPETGKANAGGKAGKTAAYDYLIV